MSFNCKLTATCAAMIMTSGAWAAQLTVINYGGALADAQQAAFVEPFKKETGTDVVASSYSGEQAKVKQWSTPPSHVGCCGNRIKRSWAGVCRWPL